MEISDHERRRRLKAWYLACAHVDALRHWIAHDEADAEHRAQFFIDTGKVLPLILPKYPPFPPECENMACGATAKSTGLPCKSTIIFKNGRCRYHGGLSTGPKSPAGKLAALGNLMQFAEPHGGHDKS